MTHELDATLVVEKGSHEGKTYRLGPQTLVLGRRQTGEGEIAFDSPFVSRAHAQIRYEHGSFWLRDLGSTNGTWINGVLLEPTKDHSLRNNDVLELGKGVVVLRFRQSEKTLKTTGGDLDVHNIPELRVDDQARDVWLEGVVLQPPLAHRDFEVLLVLFRNTGKACGKDDLAKAWGEEFVTDEQIEQSIHRLRKRIETNPSSPKRILTIRGYGYKLVVLPIPESS